MNTNSPMTRTRVKICGLTRPDDCLAAVAAGVDAIGLVFYPPSPRSVTIALAVELCRLVPPFVTVVGLFVDEPEAGVRHVLDQVPLDCLQFHGEEPPAYCAGFGRRWIKAVRMRPGLDLRSVARAHDAAAGLLLDAYDPARPGGTGAIFDWARIPSTLASSIVLAGGLDPGNVAAAIRAVRPYGVDVSGGVEAARGIKDPLKIQAFMQGVRDGDSARFDP
jgi:phosphoribosylanthranilate isomerase